MKNKNSIRKMIYHHIEDVSKEITYQLKTPQKRIEKSNLDYVSPCFYNEHEGSEIIWHKIMTFDEYKRKFHPAIDDPLTSSDELVLVMILDYAA